MLGPVNENIYRPLDSDKKEVRFLKILPPASGETSEEIRCSLCVESVESGAEFEAISYVWGDPKDTKNILVDGRSLAVTRNAFGALHVLRAKHSNPTYLWIDAICINQEDTAEKNCQVPLMRNIYSQAKTVHILLQHTATNEELLKVILDKMSAGESLDAFSKDSEYIHVYFDIIFSPWWDRLWVIQEALLASNAVFHVGRVMIRWHMLNQLRRQLMQTHAKSTKRWAGPEDNYKFMLLIKRITTFFDLKPEPISDVRSTESISKLLHYMFFKSVTEARDRVYGAIGLLPRELAIQPNYDWTVAEVYKDFTLRGMKCLQTLNLLCFGGHPKPGDNWPSWVAHFENTVFDGFPGWNASRGASCHIVERDEGSLIVRAHIIGEVSAVSLASQATSDGTPSVELGGEAVKAEHAPHVLAVWRSLVPTSDGNAELRRLRRFQFWQTMLKYTYESILTSSESNVHPHAELNELDAWLEDGNTGLSPKLKELTNSLLVSSSFTFFVLKSGLMGLTNASTAVGDAVAIVAGCDGPLILRPQLDRPSTYAVIQSCYCPGVKHGEYIHYAARQTLDRPSPFTMEAEFEGFLSILRKWYYAHNAVDLWIRSLARAKALLRRLVNKNLRLSTAYREHVVETCGLIFDIWERQSFFRRPTASTLDAILDLGRSKVFCFAEGLVMAFDCTMQEWDRTTPLSAWSEESQADQDDQDVYDLATRLGLLIFEAFIRTQAVKTSSRLTEEEATALLAFLKGYESGLDKVLAKPYAGRWLYALQIAAQEYMYIDQNVDTVFEEIVLV